MSVVVFGGGYLGQRLARSPLAGVPVAGLDSAAKLVRIEGRHEIVLIQYPALT